MVRYLFSKKERLGRALLNEVGRNARCTFPSRLEEVRRLLDAGANVNYNYGYESVLSMAGRSPWCHADIVQLLIERGANVNGTQRPGLTPPLLRAAHYSDNERLRLLIDAGADVNVRDDYYGRTPLNVLCDWADPCIIDHLLARGADPNEAAYGKTGWRPIHLTAYCGRADVIRVLRNHGVNVSARDKEGYTAADIASGHSLHKRAEWVPQEDFDAVLRVLRT